MRPLDEKLDTFPEVTTPAGRTLLNAGGIFPDLEIAEDTLTLAERELLRVAGEKDVPLGVRLAEFSFDLAKELRATGGEPAVDAARFDAFLGGLVSAGIPQDALDAPGVREYLLWRTRMTVANRMDQVGREADFRKERDPVLTEAVRLLSTASTQAQLFTAARAPHERRGEAGGAR